MLGKVPSSRNKKIKWAETGQSRLKPFYLASSEKVPESTGPSRLELASSEDASKILGFPFECSLQARKSRFKRIFIWAAQNLSGLTPFSHQNLIFKTPIHQNKFQKVFMDQNSFSTLKQT